MICQDNQRMIDAIMRLKTNEDLAVQCINKVASTSTVEEPTKPTKNKKGELSEFFKLLKEFTHSLN
jgi:hypothetical protein